MFNSELIEQAYLFYQKARFRIWNIVLHENPTLNNSQIFHGLVKPEESILECSMEPGFIDHLSDVQANKHTVKDPEADITFITKAGPALYMHNATLNTFTDINHPQVTFIGTITRMEKEEFLKYELPHEPVANILTTEHKIYLAALEAEKRSVTLNRFSNLDLED
jgi:hypothetical protein